ncbi:hypothetical protein L3X38_027911 [Prunus dulcis]|uniref:Uncharacterized protein n=1 Tax=Prunus dulcis TaxID=3755 RepID=A0AAD4VNW5_PRUDU|nr:hypothetical protein L3X38_027911 [Prunus dulcis]
MGIAWGAATCPIEYTNKEPNRFLQDTLWEAESAGGDECTCRLSIVSLRDWVGQCRIGKTPTAHKAGLASLGFWTLFGVRFRPPVMA